MRRPLTNATPSTPLQPTVQEFFRVVDHAQFSRRQRHQYYSLHDTVDDRAAQQAIRR